jgi:hypothetical protein
MAAPPQLLRTTPHGGRSCRCGEVVARLALDLQQHKSTRGDVMSSQSAREQGNHTGPELRNGTSCKRKNTRSRARTVQSDLTFETSPRALAMFQRKRQKLGRCPRLISNSPENMDFPSITT